MLKSLAAIGAATFLALTLPATAADKGGPAYPPPDNFYAPYDPPPSSIWAGTYIGISAGYGWGTSEQNYIRNDNHGAASTDPEGGFGALTLGYNVILGPGFVGGVEGDLGFMDLSADDKIVYDGHVYKTRFGPFWGSARLRAGALFGNTLVYGTGGVAFMELDDISIGNTPGETAFNEDFKTGWVVGAGIEHAFSERTSLKLEYLHFGFETYNGLSDNREAFSFDNDVDLVRVGLNYKF